MLIASQVTADMIQQHKPQDIYTDNIAWINNAGQSLQKTVGSPKKD